MRIKRERGFLVLCLNKLRLACDLIEFHLQDLMNLARPNTTIKIGVEIIPAALPDKVNFGVEEINYATAVDHAEKAVAFINDLRDLHALIKESHNSLTLIEKACPLLKNLRKEIKNGYLTKANMVALHLKHPPQVLVE